MSNGGVFGVPAAHSKSDIGFAKTIHSCICKIVCKIARPYIHAYVSVGAGMNVGLFAKRECCD